jgi:hypothetical protein
MTAPLLVAYYTTWYVRSCNVVILDTSLLWLPEFAEDMRINFTGHIEMNCLLYLSNDT